MLAGCSANRRCLAACTPCTASGLVAVVFQLHASKVKLEKAKWCEIQLVSIAVLGEGAK
jgi:hypothetical protein